PPAAAATAARSDAGAPPPASPRTGPHPPPVVPYHNRRQPSRTNLLNFAVPPKLTLVADKAQRAVVGELEEIFQRDGLPCPRCEIPGVLAREFPELPIAGMPSG